MDPERGPPQRGSRTRLACSRCQKRKIKCDGQIPACSSCRKAGTICSSGNTSRDRGYSRTYVSSLWNRIRFLESALDTESPGFDFSQAPVIENLEEQGASNDSGTFQTGTPIHQETSLDPSRIVINDENYNTNEHNNRVASGTDPESTQSNERVHDIGLVSVGAGQDLRYVGPSSGHAFAKLLLKVTGVPTTRVRKQERSQNSSLNGALLQALQIAPAPLPEKLEHAVQLSSVFFETMHPQWPFLHQPTHLKRLDHVYTSSQPKGVYKFQAFMVLAISATILSHRYKTVLSAEGFAASALKAFEQAQVEGLLDGLQCLLLLVVYALLNPSSRLNAWYLNYQAIAAVVDLGLQRDVKSGLSLLTREMRTRIFWVVYALDRTLGTTLGQPKSLSFPMVNIVSKLKLSPSIFPLRIVRYATFYFQSVALFHPY